MRSGRDQPKVGAGRGPDTELLGCAEIIRSIDVESQG